MTKSPIFKLISFGFLAWLVPFFVSIFMIDSSRLPILYKPDYITFKLTMIVILIIITTLGYSIMRWYTKLNWVITAITFLLFSCVLDIVVLINIFKFSNTDWVLTVLPSYLVIFFGLGYLILRRETTEEAKTMAINKANEVKQTAVDKVNDIIH
jgi:uncharacterized membrane protein YidH (DUF202 family)